MKKIVHYIGLDVHKETNASAELAGGMVGRGMPVQPSLRDEGGAVRPIPWAEATRLPAVHRYAMRPQRNQDGDRVLKKKGKKKFPAEDYCLLRARD